MIRDLELQDGVTPEDVEEFKKTLLIQKSLAEVKRRALEYEEIRNSPERYRKVKSTVKRNLKV